MFYFGNKIRRACGMLLAAALLLGLFAGCGAGSGGGLTAAPGKNKTGADETLLDKLGDKIDKNTLVLYMKYDGLEEDVKNYRGSLTDAGMIEFELTQEHLRSGFVDALAAQRDKVCVIGVHASFKGYENNTALSYNMGVFRLLPYSSFWLKDVRSLSGYVSVNGKTEQYTVYEFTYFDYSDADIARMKREIDAEVNDVVARIPSNADTWTKAKLAHDELISRMEYDHSFGEHCHDLYGAFVLRKPVCESYALAYKLVLEKVGVTSNVVVNNWEEANANGAGHAWNHILGVMGDDTYVDVTWDDRDTKDERGRPYISYDYFGLTLEELNAVESHSANADSYGWYVNPETFNYYRHEGYVLSSYGTSAVAEKMRGQYRAGLNLLSVRFDNRAAYDRAKTAASGTRDIADVLTQLGYSGNYWYYLNDTTLTLSVGLGKLPQNANG